MVSTPQEAQHNLDNINNRITMAEAETRRLQDLKFALESDITALNKEQKYREGEVFTLREQISTFTASINEHKKTVANADRIKDEQKKGWEELTFAQAELENDGNAMVEKATAREDALDERDTILADRERDFDARNSALYEKETKLRQLIAELQADK